MKDYFIETNRLGIRRLQEDDLSSLTSVLGNPFVMHFSAKGRPLIEQEICDRLQKYFADYGRFGFSQWAIELKNDGAFIGIAGIQHVIIDGIDEIEIGYRLAPIYWGQGYATEASLAIRDYAYNTLGISRLIALIEPQNERSIRVAEKLGMSYEKDTVYMRIPARVYAAYKYRA